MKLKEVLSRVRNKNNNQTVWNPKKRKLKELNISEEDLLNLKIDKDLARGLR